PRACRRREIDPGSVLEATESPDLASLPLDRQLVAGRISENARWATHLQIAIANGAMDLVRAGDAVLVDIPVEEVRDTSSRSRWSFIRDRHTHQSGQAAQHPIVRVNVAVHDRRSLGPDIDHAPLEVQPLLNTARCAVAHRIFDGIAKVGLDQLAPGGMRPLDGRRGPLAPYSLGHVDRAESRRPKNRAEREHLHGPESVFERRRIAHGASRRLQPTDAGPFASDRTIEDDRIAIAGERCSGLEDFRRRHGWYPKLTL